MVSIYDKMLAPKPQTAIHASGAKLGVVLGLEDIIDPIQIKPFDSPLPKRSDFIYEVIVSIKTSPELSAHQKPPS